MERTSGAFWLDQYTWDKIGKQQKPADLPSAQTRYS